ncbi:MAG: 4'-phosphopantetheinyl transferase superfamily protein [Verrucomicrobia bacterium]|nr:4'-phosphopantetheinyl transferase superfamily protein [Verrucomicrobiota bacterium]
MKPEITFKPPPQTLELASGEVHVFCSSLDQPRERMEQLTDTLSEDERHRAGRFRFKKDLDRFVAGRGMLREILGWLMGVKPKELSFSYSPNGKPHLTAPTGKKFPHFNVSHTGSLAVYAVSLEHEVGIDIERIRPLRETEDIAAHFFSQSERTQWRSLQTAAKTEAFFNCWVRKEALLKAFGKGIGEPLNQVEVFFGGDLFSGAQFTLRSLLLPVLNHVAAVAVKCRAPLISCWHREAC